MSVATLLFYFFEVLAIGAAAGIVFTRNVFYGALYLIICLLSIAALYVLSAAEFLAVTQILVYAGGILVVIIFGVMLTAKITGRPLVVEHGYKLSGALVALALSGLLIYAFSKESFTIATQANTTDNLKQIGMGMMTSFLLPFEIVGFLLLVALIGAIVISSSAKSDKA